MGLEELTEGRIGSFCNSTTTMRDFLSRLTTVTTRDE